MDFKGVIHEPRGQYIKFRANLVVYHFCDVLSYKKMDFKFLPERDIPLVLIYHSLLHFYALVNAYEALMRVTKMAW